MSNSHTPGPWNVCAGVSVAAESEKFVLMSAPHINHYFEPDHRSKEVDQANIRLAAAAPDMLEALRRLLDAYGEAHALYDLGECDGSLMARAAMAKAGANNDQKERLES